MPTEAVSPADLRNYLGFARQTVKGTGVAPNYFAAFVDSITFGQDPHIRPIREAGGGQTIARQVKDFVSTGIVLATPARPDIAGALFAYLLGTAGAPSGAGPYTHTITWDPGAVWLTLERSLADDVIERAVDGMILELVASFTKRDSGPEVMLAATVDALSQVFRTSATAESYETDAPFSRHHCTWTINGDANTNVESCIFTFSIAADQAMLADALQRAGLVKLHLEVGIELVQLFQSTAEGALYREVHYGADDGLTQVPEVFRGAITVNANNGAAAGANRQLTIAIPQVDWGESVLTEPNPGGTEAVRLTTRGVMVANPGGEPVTVTAINDRETGYIV